MARLEDVAPAPRQRSGAGILFVVATPIGNLEDITLRALRVLRESDLVAAEDTRRTSHLLTHYGIPTKLVSLHEHNERRRIPEMVSRLAGGGRVALVTDAGTPGASDPGMLLVKAAREQGIRVEPVPGPSALLAALSAAGEPFDAFSFRGFPPVKSKARKQWFIDVSSTPETTVFFESPHRLRRTLGELAIISGERPIHVCRELTKVHEEIVSGTTATILDRLGEPRGEYTIVLGPLPLGETAQDVVTAANLDDLVAHELGETPENSRGSKRDRLRAIADRLGVKVSEVYQASERIKNRP